MALSVHTLCAALYHVDPNRRCGPMQACRPSTRQPIRVPEEAAGIHRQTKKARDRLAVPCVPRRRALRRWRRRDAAPPRRRPDATARASCPRRSAGRRTHKIVWRRTGEQRQGQASERARDASSGPAGPLWQAALEHPSYDRLPTDDGLLCCCMNIDESIPCGWSTTSSSTSTPSSPARHEKKHLGEPITDPREHSIENDINLMLNGRWYFDKARNFHDARHLF